MPRGAKKDIAVTKLLRRNGLLLDNRSFISLGIEPHLYLKGDDVIVQRQRVFRRAKGKCQKCGKEVGVFEGEMDHIIPKGKGGSDDFDNLQWLCSEDHRTKHVQVEWQKTAIKDFNKIYPQEVA